MNEYKSPWNNTFTDAAVLIEQKTQARYNLAKRYNDLNEKLNPSGKRLWVETASGLRFDILAGDKEIVYKPDSTEAPMAAFNPWGGEMHPPYLMKDVVESLKKTIRYNGHKPVSVAQHSFFCEKLAERFFGFDQGIVQHCASHDLHESFVGDLVFPVRTLFPDFAELEYVILEKTRHTLFSYYIGVEDELTNEAVKIIDHLAFLCEKREFGVKSDSEWGLIGRNFSETLVRLITIQLQSLGKFANAIYAKRQTADITAAEVTRLTEALEKGRANHDELCAMSAFEFQKICSAILEKAMIRYEYEFYP